EVCQPFEEACTHIVVHDFRTRNQPLRLVCQHRSNLRSPMTYIRNSMTGSTVNIFAPLIVPQQRSTSTHYNHRALTIYSACVCVLSFNARVHAELLSISRADVLIVVPSPSSTAINDLLPIWTRGTPPRTASCAPSNFLRIRPWAYCMYWSRQSAGMVLM